MEILKPILHAKAALLLLVAGLVCILLALFAVHDVTHGDIAPRATTAWMPLAAGVVLLLASAGTGLAARMEHLAWPDTGAHKVAKLGDGWSATVAQSAVKVRFGRVERVAEPSDETLVVLPANEFFDDACIADQRSALGAFVAAHFMGQEQALLTVVREKLRGVATTSVESSDGTRKPSYGVGTSAYLPGAMGKKWNILLVAVTTDRAGEGLRAELSAIFAAVKAVERTMTDRRLARVVLPLIGSGHGCLNPRAALSASLVAFIEALQRPTGPRLHDVTIVIFQRDEKTPPSVSVAEARHLMSRALDIYHA